MTKLAASALIASCLVSSAARAQAVLQAGPVLSNGGHAAMYVPGQGSATLMDSGPAGGYQLGQGLSELLQVNRSTPGTGPLGTHNCLYDQADPSNSLGERFLCFDAGALGGPLIASGSVGPAATKPLQFSINGTLYTFPFITNNSVVPTCPVIGAYGGSPGATDNTSALNAALAAQGANVCVSFPPGTFTFLSNINYVLPTSVAGVTIQGQGPEATVLLWPNAAGGLAITETTHTQSTTVANMSIATGVTSGGTGLLLTNTAAFNGAAGLEPANFVSNVLFRGSDGYSATNYWNNNAKIVSMNNVNFINDMMTGDSGFHTVGINLTTAVTTSAVYNIINLQAECVGIGLQIGANIQGVTVGGGSNFVCGNKGIFVPSGQTGLDQLTVSDSSFNESVAGIDIESPVNVTDVHDNLFISTTTNATGILVNANEIFNLHHNFFQFGNGSVALAGSAGIKLTGAGMSGNVGQNQFFGTATGISLGAAVSGAFVQADNVFTNFVTTSIVNSGTAFVNGEAIWTPTLAGSTAAGSNTYTTQVGSYFRNFPDITVRFNILTSAISGMTGNLLIGGLPFASANIPGDAGACSLSAVGGITALTGGTFSGQIMPNSSAINLTYITSNPASTAQIPTGDAVAATTVQGFCSYRTN